MRKIISVMMFLFILGLVDGSSFAKVGSESTVSPMKHWEITFSTSMDPSTIDASTMYVEDVNGNKLEQELFFTENNTKVTVKAPAGGYEQGKEYTLYIDKSIQSSQGVPLKEPMDFEFKIDSKKALVSITSMDVHKETVTLFNAGDTAVDMTGWSLLSVEGNQRYHFPEGYTLQPQKIVTITSGKNAREDLPEYLKWTTGYMWNNESDAAKLLNQDNEVMSEHQ